MSIRMTEDEYRAFLQRTGRNTDGDRREGKRSKYGNQRTEADGISFDSKHEAAAWKELKLRMRDGEYMAVARQVRFQLPGKVEYVADFVVFRHDGSYEVLDAKSSATAKNAVYRMKKKQMKECLGITIREV